MTSSPSDCVLCQRARDFLLGTVGGRSTNEKNVLQSRFNGI